MTLRLMLALALLVPLAPAIAATPPAVPESPCQPAVAAAEKASRVPARLLTTISMVESGRANPATGHYVAWPWTINAAGIGFFYATKEEAVAAARAMHQSGVNSIDVGCMQISLLFHPNAFATLEDAFDPQTNATYGGHFLAALFGQTGNWPAAAAAYHSQTPELGAEYQQRVMALWPLAAKYPPLPVVPAGPPPPDLSRYTPEFRAILIQMHADYARLEARYARAPTPPPVAAPPVRAVVAAPVPGRGKPVQHLPAAPLWTADAGRGGDQLTSR